MQNAEEVRFNTTLPWDGRTKPGERSVVLEFFVSFFSRKKEKKEIRDDDIHYDCLHCWSEGNSLSFFNQPRAAIKSVSTGKRRKAYRKLYIKLKSNITPEIIKNESFNATFPWDGRTKRGAIGLSLNFLFLFF